jgi:choline dehydrogenase
MITASNAEAAANHEKKLSTHSGSDAAASAETTARFNPPTGSWTMAAGVVRPKSRGHIRLSAQIEANTLSHPDELKAAIAGVELSHEIGNSRRTSLFRQA